MYSPVLLNRVRDGRDGMAICTQLGETETETETRRGSGVRIVTHIRHADWLQKSVLLVLRLIGHAYPQQRTKDTYRMVMLDVRESATTKASCSSVPPAFTRE